MENLNVVELNKPEMLEISGGSGRIGRIVRGIRITLEAIGAVDAYHSFREGWDSVECE